VQVEQARVKQADANLLLARARLQVAQADLKQAEVFMDYAAIRAPYDGVVTERLIDTGDFARSAANGTTEALFTLMRETPLRIVVDIPESDAGWVRTGLEATLSVDGIKDHTSAGLVQRTAGTLDPQMHTLRIEVELNDPPHGLRPGMYGAVTITDSQPIQAARSTVSN
jgi:RND family efflux transporter MFP subunit